MINFSKERESDREVINFSRALDREELFWREVIEDGRIVFKIRDREYYCSRMY